MIKEFKVNSCKKNQKRSRRPERNSTQSPSYLIIARLYLLTHELFVLSFLISSMYYHKPICSYSQPPFHLQRFHHQSNPVFPAVFSCSIPSLVDAFLVFLVSRPCSLFHFLHAKGIKQIFLSKVLR